MAEPLDLDEIFSPYSAPPKLKKQEDTTIMGVVKNAFKEGRGGYVLGGAGALTAGFGVKKAWDKSVKSNLVMVQEAAKAEAEAITKAKDAGFRVRPVTLNRPLVGTMSGATSGGVGLPVAEAEQLALAKDVTKSKWLRTFGLGKYADSALTPKVEITPRYLRIAGQGEPTLGLTQMTMAETPRSYVIPASEVPAVIEGASKESISPTANSVGRTLAADLPAPRSGLPLNNYERLGKAMADMQYGNARLPLNSAGNVGKALFKSGAGLQAVAEGLTAAYDTWPQFLGGSGNNVYGRTVEELRSGVNPNLNPFAYNVVAPFGGGLATAKRVGWGALNAVSASIPYMASEMFDINELDKKTKARLESEFEKNPEKFNPAELERQRIRRIQSGMATSSDEFRLDTPEAYKEYEEKVKSLKEKKK